MPEKDLSKFESLFKEHFIPLCGFAGKYVKDLDDAKGVVHEVFIAVWNNFQDLDTGQNFRSYLYTSVRNRCMNFIRDHKQMVALSSVKEDVVTEENTDLETKELEKEIEYAVNSLPDKCRKIFEMSRMEGLKYGEIAQKMNISIKTVEAQMSKALRILRDHLAHFLTVFFFIVLQ